MIAYVYNLPSWISNPDNKPSYNLWQIILKNHSSSKIECKTISQPTLTTLSIQSSYSVSDWYKFNYVNFNNWWYIIDSVNYVSDNNQVVEVNCHIDIYLSFIVQYFDENSTLSNLVFFIQKHLNRWVYKTVLDENWGESGSSIVPVTDFSKQFYLKNKHQGLSGIGSLTNKTVDVVTDYIYNGAYMKGATSNGPSATTPTPISQITMNNNDCVGYLYYLWKMTSHESAQAQWNNYSSMGLMNVTNNPSFYSLSYYPLVNPPPFSIATEQSNSCAITCIPWWYSLQNFGKDAYVDLITLPVPVEFALIGTYTNVFARLVNSYNNENDTWQNEVVSCIYNYAPGSITDNSILINNMDANFILVYNVVPQNLYYFFTDNPQSTNNFIPIYNIQTIEPYILQYCSFRVRGGGEDAVVDLTAFDNFTPAWIIYTLYSFCINMNHPVTQITNIHYKQLQNIYNWYNNQQLDWFNNINYYWYFSEPYGYNPISDAWYILNWKSTYPSSSNNWNNYLLNNLNNYHMGLSIAQFNMQAAQSAVVFDAIKSFLGLGTAATTLYGVGTGADVSGFVGDASVSSSVGGFVGDVGSLTNGIFNMQTQEQKYQYLLNGKKGDMSRTSNERLSVSNNAISYNNFALTFIFECPVEYEQLACINFCALNGYILERWLPFKYWYNRTYCNFVKIAYFTDSICPSMNKTYKNLIDGILNNGVRIWTSANITMSLTNSMNTIPFTTIIYQFFNEYTNKEVKQNNDEINFLNGVF